MVLIAAFLRIEQSNHTRVNLGEWHQQQVKNVCSRLTLLSIPHVSDSQFLYVSGSFDFYVSDELQYVYCNSPKVATTSWLLAFLRLTGKKLSTIRDVHNTEQTAQILKRAVHYTPEQRQTILKKYYKFMFVREPLERLISAYRDKCIKRAKCREKMLQSPSSKTGESVK